MQRSREPLKESKGEPTLLRVKGEDCHRRKRVEDEVRSWVEKVLIPTMVEKFIEEKVLNPENHHA